MESLIGLIPGFGDDIYRLMPAAGIAMHAWIRQHARK